MNFDTDLEASIGVGLPLTYEYFTPALPGENCYVTGDEASLRILVWRYVSPLDPPGYVTEATADHATKEDFEHFWWPVPDYADADYTEYRILAEPFNRNGRPEREARYEELRPRYEALEAAKA